jgi:hypothetical protein
MRRRRGEHKVMEEEVMPHMPYHVILLLLVMLHPLAEASCPTPCGVVG